MTIGDMSENDKKTTDAENLTPDTVPGRDTSVSDNASSDGEPDSLTDVLLNSGLELEEDGDVVEDHLTEMASDKDGDDAASDDADTRDDADGDDKDTPDDAKDADDAEFAADKNEQADDQRDTGDSDNADDTDDADDGDGDNLLLTNRDFRQMKNTLRPKVRRLQEAAIAMHQQLEGVQPLAAVAQEFALPPESVTELSQLARAWYSGNHDEFLDAVTPYVMAAQQAMGYTLPDDLQEQVDDGYITEEAATELARLRAQTAQQQTQFQRQQQQTQQSQQTQNINMVRDALNGWEQDIRKRDPDFAPLRDTTLRLAQAEMQRTNIIPSSPQQAIQLVEAAYAEAKRLAGQANTPRPTSRRPDGSSRASTGKTRAEPKTMMDAIAIGLADAR